MKLSAALIVAIALSACASAGRVPLPVIEIAPDSGPANAEICRRNAGILRQQRDRLGLRDWTLHLYCGAAPAFATDAGCKGPDDCDGASSMFTEGRDADIWISPLATDPTETAIHELLHLWFDSICEDGGDVLEEQGLRVIARLLRKGG